MQGNKKVKIVEEVKLPKNVMVKLINNRNE
jgi:hypothetical protein